MAAPDQIGKYRLLRLLATGGMGEIYLARQEGPAGFSRRVVIKRILRHLALDRRFVELFLNEARLAAMISHPNVVQIFDFGLEDGQYYIAMELVHGRSLRQVLRRAETAGQPLSPTVAARIGSLVLQGLHHAHRLSDEQGRALQIVHRDISPDNVLISFTGQVKVLDFGIAKAVSAAEGGPRSTRVQGKYLYLPPEQLRGDAVDARADLYAVGAMLFEVLTGRPPLELTNDADALAAAAAPVRTPTSLRPDLPPPLETILLRALQKEPDRRYGSAEEMANALEGYLRQADAHVGAPELTGALEALFGEEVHRPLDQTPADAVGAAATGALTGVAAPAEAATQLATLLPPPAAEHPGRRRALALVGAALLALGGVAIWAAARVELPPAALAQAAAPSVPAPALPAPVPAKPEATRPDSALTDSALTDSAVTGAAVTGPLPTAGTATGTHRRRPGELAKSAARSSRGQRVQAERRAAPPHSGEGKVSVRVKPWAEVLHDGKSLGITPLAPVTVPAGPQTFLLRNAQLGVERKVRVTVPAGGEAVIKENLLEAAPGQGVAGSAVP